MRMTDWGPNSKDRVQNNHHRKKKKTGRKKTYICLCLTFSWDPHKHYCKNKNHLCSLVFLFQFKVLLCLGFSTFCLVYFVGSPTQYSGSGGSCIQICKISCFWFHNFNVTGRKVVSDNNAEAYKTYCCWE